MKTLSLLDVKEKMVHSYIGYVSEFDMSRGLLIHKSFSDNDPRTPGYFFFALQGSPPKAFAVYSPDHHFLIIGDAWGKCRKFSNIGVDVL